jgi:hypothetical protein
MIYTKEEITDSSLVLFDLRGVIMENAAFSQASPTTVNSLVRTREYLTGAEIERALVPRSAFKQPVLLRGSPSPGFP